MVSPKKQVISEFFASFILGWLGLRAIVPLIVESHIKDLFQYSWYCGLIIAFVIIIFDPISGAQFNYGVTLALPSIWHVIWAPESLD